MATFYVTTLNTTVNTFQLSYKRVALLKAIVSMWNKSKEATECFRFMSSALSHMPDSPFVDNVRPTDTIILRRIYYGVDV